MEAAADAGGPARAARLRLVWRVVRVAELLVLVVVISRSFPHLPSAAAAASSVLRLAASFLVRPRSVFLLANAIVLLLLALFRRDGRNSASSRDAAQDQLLSFSDPPPMLPSIAEAPAPAPEEDAVFEDKQAVHVTVRSRAPRRSKSEKVSGGGGRRRAASPEPPRSGSENGQRRRSTSTSAAVEWGVEDEAEFRRAVEAFIAKQQTRFHSEESLVLVDGGEAAAGIAGAVGASR